ncbi:Viral IAP-associated factor homolog [Geodia barretti]|uniref:Viral IAP-associated factor homolog n=1 Tax=Geodia barretti TaxID=519541 RepID=A0AA35WGL8_GEOBA|nr:Viral IAP-associated factor homolog [Geodia barretti]
MQNPNEDTEWNDILRAKGILPPKKEEPTISEDTVVQLVEDAVQQRIGQGSKAIEDMTLDELDEMEDEEDDRVLHQYRAGVDAVREGGSKDRARQRPSQEAPDQRRHVRGTQEIRLCGP